MLKLGVVGYGYWGPNVVRNFASQPDCRVVTICDTNPKAVAQALRHHPAVHATSNPDEVMRSSEIDAVAVVTPVSTHYDLAKKALENGKHVFVEKPFTATSAQAEELIELADRKNLQIMVDHTFLFNGAVRKIKELVDGGVLGPLYYYDSTRVNLGLFQHDVNVIWDLAPHDLSIIDYLIGLEPELVVATGGAHLNGLADMAYITLHFPKNIIAHLNVNWLSPVKVRTTLVGGQRKMLVWNDLEPSEKVKVYDKGIQVTDNHDESRQRLKALVEAKVFEVGEAQAVHDLLVSYRSGDMWSPQVDQTEALQLEARYFLDCLASGEKPVNDGRAGLRVVKMLEAADQSLKHRREIVYASSRGPDRPGYSEVPPIKFAL
ncbi:MAG: Gfo/Idh/MocA family oxidoreductase [Thaumarchaeota archaeon]|nr:MAG: Gfo/Idh/MocA family oxidoreductase [Nitrososphaerota archaeon]